MLAARVLSVLLVLASIYVLNVSALPARDIVAVRELRAEGTAAVLIDAVPEGIVKRTSSNTPGTVDLTQRANADEVENELGVGVGVASIEAAPNAYAIPSEDTDSDGRLSKRMMVTAFAECEEANDCGNRMTMLDLPGDGKASSASPTIQLDVLPRQLQLWTNCRKGNNAETIPRCVAWFATLKQHGVSPSMGYVKPSGASTTELSA